MWHIKQNRNKWTDRRKQKQTHRYKQKIGGFQREGGSVESERVQGSQIYGDGWKVAFALWACCTDIEF